VNQAKTKKKHFGSRIDGVEKSWL